jgi:hypothetical protein
MPKQNYKQNCSLVILFLCCWIVDDMTDGSGLNGIKIYKNSLSS